MATQTPYLSLVLMQTGENVGTWGIPLNQNFQTIDTIAGEIISARGSNSNVSERFGVIDSELTGARGTFSSINDRLNYLINPDGTSRIENFSKATSQTFGVVRLSKPSSDPSNPVVVETTDPRMLTAIEKNELTSGGITHVHKHYLADLADVTATAKEVSQALHGISENVTASNLSLLVSGGVVPKTLMTVPAAAYGSTGIVSLSASPTEGANPVAVGTNDSRLLSQTQKDELTSGVATSLHKHRLADAATDLNVTATGLNRLAGSSVRVNASNLDALTAGGNTTLHHHDVRYYPRSEMDAAIQTVEARVTEKISNHSSSESAHENANLRLGKLTAKSFSVTEAGGTIQIRAHADDAPTAQQIQVKDNSGLVVASIDASGTITAKKLITDIQEVKEVQTTKQKAVMTSSLEVNGNTVLGDDAASDTLVVNTVTSEFKGAVSVAGALTVTGAVNGVNLLEIQSNVSSVKSEVEAARGDMGSLKEAIDGIKNKLTQSIDGVKNARNNPNQVTLTQAIAADDGTDITTALLETLSDGSSADALHTHKKYDDVLAAIKESSLFGSFETPQARLESIEQKISSATTEIQNARNGEASVDAHLDKLSAKLVENTGKITALETGASSASSSIQTLTSNVSNIQGQISGFTSQIGNLTAADISINQEISTIKNNASSLSGVQSSLLSRVSAVETKSTEIQDALKGKINTVDTTSSIVRKQVITDVDLNSSTNVVTQTKFTDIGITVVAYDQASGAKLKDTDFETFAVSMNSSVAQVSLKTTASVGTKRVRLVIMG